MTHQQKKGQKKRAGLEFSCQDMQLGWSVNNQNRVSEWKGHRLVLSQV